MSNSHLMSTYARLPVVFVRGEGAWLWDEQNNQYLDALSGIAVCGLGHAHPAVTKAIQEQASQLIHTSNLYGIPLQEQLANQLCDLSSMDKAFFANSGAEANEAAIKLARKHAHQRGIDNPCIILAHKSFHGRTLTTLSATGNPTIQQGFEPLVSGFIHVEYNHIEELESACLQHPNTIAIMLEPVQGESGVNVPDNHYLSEIRKLCDRHQLLMILDEIQTGICRTGKWFAHQHEGVLPDVMTLAKGLGNGVPIGACLARGEAANVLTAGSHGSTFGGNPLVCAAALATIQTMQQQNLAERTLKLGQWMLEQFEQQLADVKAVVNIRGKGLMLGIELDHPCAYLVTEALQQKILINVAGGKVIRLLPPLIISDQQAQTIIEKVTQLIKQHLRKNS